MSVKVEVPRTLVVDARRYYRQTRRPLLFGVRPGDVRLDAIRGAGGRYMLVLDPEHGRQLGLLDDPDRDPMTGLLEAVAVALNLEPISFVSEGRRVGKVEIIETPLGTLAVRVRGHLSLTYLSWLLYEGRAGFFVSLLATVPPSTRRQLQQRSATDG